MYIYIYVNKALKSMFNQNVATLNPISMDTLRVKMRCWVS